MGLRSISGFTCYVKDINKTVEFYEKMGFVFKSTGPERATMYLNWYKVDFIASGKEDKKDFLAEASAEPKGSGIYINVNVDDVDEFYQELVKKGLKPSSEPRDWPWGNREFVIRDPDGYKLVIFKKK